MTDEIEVPTEHLHEDIEHMAHHSGEKWIVFVALSSALLAVFAATSALLAGHHANEAMIEQIQSSDQWAFYQAKGTKAAILESKMELLDSLGKMASAGDRKKLQNYKAQQNEIQQRANEKQISSEQHLKHHNTLAKSVTIFQVAIALGAISALTKKKILWLGSVALGISGLVFFILGLS
jgi:hypothetical protein